MIFVTKINGVPYKIKVLHYVPARPNKLSGAMEDAEEGYPAEFEYLVLSMDNQIDYELNTNVTAEEEDRLIDEYEAAILADKYGKDF
jgi:hypothetical protein